MINAQPLRILFVEDDPLLQEIYAMKFHEAGYKVAIVDAGNKVIPELEKEMPDVVLLDIVLPRQNGWDVLTDIRKNPTWKDLKVIMLSNLGQKEDTEKATRLGATMYMIKARVTPSEVVEAIKKLFQ